MTGEMHVASGEYISEYQALIDSQPSGVWSVDTEYRLTVWNRACHAVFRDQYGIELKRGLLLPEAFPAEIGELWKERYDRALAGERFVLEEEASLAGRSYLFELRFSPVFHDERIVGVSVVSSDVTGQREQIRRKTVHTERFQYILDLAADLSGEVTDLDSLYKKILDYLAKTIDLVSASVQLLEEDKLRIVAYRGFLHDDVVEELSFPLEDPFPNALVVRERRSLSVPDIRTLVPHFESEASRYESGHIRSWLGVPMIVGDTVVGVLTVDRATVSPFTEEEVQLVSTFGAHVAAAINNARLYQSLARAAETKEYLLRELHHRVKNNMQLVSSILSLQGRNLSDDRAREILRELQLRIRSLGLVHEALHEALEVGAIDLGEYMRSVVSSILSEYSFEKRITPHYEMDALMVGVDVSVPVGLIIGELVLNAVKHAFPDERTGTLQCVLRRKDDSVHLTLADNGIGLPEDVEIAEAQSFGMRLLSALSEQLGGALDVERKEGTLWTLSFTLGELSASS